MRKRLMRWVLALLVLLSGVVATAYSKLPGQKDPQPASPVITIPDELTGRHVMRYSTTVEKLG